jgi:hypothetical protein
MYCDSKMLYLYIPNTISNSAFQSHLMSHRAFLTKSSPTLNSRRNYTVHSSTTRSVARHCKANPPTPDTPDGISRLPDAQDVYFVRPDFVHLTLVNSVS